MTLYLVRHGKASHGSAHYDALSALGARQARATAARMVREGARVRRVFSGPLARQVSTAQEMVAHARELGAPWPEMQVLDALAEAPLDGIVREWVPRHIERDAQLRPFLPALSRVDESLASNVALTPFLDHLVARWVDGEFEAEGYEPYLTFTARVLDALATLRREHLSGTDVLAVTSAGVLYTIVRSLRGEPAASRPAMDDQRFANASITRLREHDGTLEVAALDDAEHLGAEHMLSYL